MNAGSETPVMAPPMMGYLQPKMPVRSKLIVSLLSAPQRERVCHYSLNSFQRPKMMRCISTTPSIWVDWAASRMQRSTSYSLAGP